MKIEAKKIVVLAAAGLVITSQLSEMVDQNGHPFRIAGLALASPHTGPTVDSDSNQVNEQSSRDVVPVFLSEAGITNAKTSSAVEVLGAAQSDCGSLSPVYRAECLARALEEAADKLSGIGYAAARKELRTAARRIRIEVAQNVDTTKPKIRRKGKTLRAVKRRSVRKVNRKVRRIITETRTALLRSAGSSKKRRTHYARIARAVNSTKVLMRS